MVELEWKESTKIPDGSHKGIITRVEYRHEPYEYTDIFVKLEDSEIEMKYGCPTVLSENSKLGRLMVLFGENFKKGGLLDPAVVLKGREVTFMTITKKGKGDKEFSEIVEDSLKPAG